ncbi:hypothetical protein ACV1R9_002248 [Salmonella enterica subsp. enterica serovar Bareilly]
MNVFLAVVLIIAVVVLVTQFIHWRRCRNFNKSPFGRNPYGSKKYEDEESSSLLKVIIAIVAIVYALCKLW